MAAQKVAAGLSQIPVVGGFLGGIASLFGGNGPSKARMFLDSQMAWVRETQQALNQGAYSANPTLARAVLQDLDARVQQAYTFEKTAKIEAGRGGGHEFFGEVAKLRQGIEAALASGEQRQAVFTYGGFGVGALLVIGALWAISRKRSGG